MAADGRRMAMWVVLESENEPNLTAAGVIQALESRTGYQTPQATQKSLAAILPSLLLDGKFATKPATSCQACWFVVIGMLAIASVSQQFAPRRMTRTNIVRCESLEPR